MLRFLIKAGLVVAAIKSIIWWRRDSRAIRAFKGRY